MTTASAVLARLGRRGWLPPWGAAGLARFTGFQQALTRRTSIQAALAHPDVAVPYRLRSEALGLGSFPLAQDGAVHAAARRIVADVMAQSATAHQRGVAAAAATAESAMAAADDAVDVVADVIDPALRAWVETWFGLPGCGEELQAAGRAVMHAMFLNPQTPRRATDAAGLAWAVEAVRTTADGLLAPMQAAGPGTVAARLVAHAPEEEVAFLLGLTVGPLALGSKALAETVDHLLDQQGLDDVDVDGGRFAFERAIAERPPLPGLPRSCPHAVTVDLPRDRLRLEAGPFLAATSAAATVDHRPDELAFGLGPHACMGRTQVTDVAAAVLAAIGAHQPRRRPGEGGRLRRLDTPAEVDEWPFPGHLTVGCT